MEKHFIFLVADIAQAGDLVVGDHGAVIDELLQLAG
jgi:hypothetical protein